MEEKRICDHCGCVMSENEGTTVGDEVICETCVEDYCITCDHCGNVIYTDDCITDDHILLCTDCYEDYYRRSTPLDQRVLDVMIDVYQNKYGNADSRTHDFGETARSTVEGARKQVAELLAVKQNEGKIRKG